MNSNLAFLFSANNSPEDDLICEGHTGSYLSLNAELESAIGALEVLTMLQSANLDTMTDADKYILMGKLSVLTGTEYTEESFKAALSKAGAAVVAVAKKIFSLIMKLLGLQKKEASRRAMKLDEIATWLERLALAEKLTSLNQSINVRLSTASGLVISTTGFDPDAFDQTLTGYQKLIASTGDAIRVALTTPESILAVEGFTEFNKVWDGLAKFKDGNTYYMQEDTAAGLSITTKEMDSPDPVFPSRIKTTEEYEFDVAGVIIVDFVAFIRSVSSRAKQLEVDLGSIGDMVGIIDKEIQTKVPNMVQDAIVGPQLQKMVRGYGEFIQTILDINASVLAEVTKFASTIVTAAKEEVKAAK